ncbi:MAG TPA: sulfite exporter TauE/SafE family protein, partial [Bacteroidetes bacterium]|nr:sulfite exporter TauE/SafE family protein [Bacteroidota bacterium]
METYQYLIAVGGGFLAGILNAIAGFGSVVTLSIMIEFMGMPANLANGTNRINMFTQTSMSSLAYFRQGKLNFSKCKLAVILSFVGAMFGVILALNISNEAFKEVFRYLLIVMFLAVLVNPKRWIHETDPDFKMSRWISVPLFLLLGFYGGFIQMGMGLFTLIVLVLIAKFNLVEANAIKVFIIALY